MERTEKAKGGEALNDELIVVDAEAFAEHEQIIANGIKTFAEVGNALLAIRDGRMYRENYATFEAYCRERWGFSRSRAHRLIDAAIVCEVLPVGNKPESERQTRPLASLPQKDRAPAWSGAVDRAESEGRKVTTADVEAEVAKRKRPAIFKTPEQEEEWYAKQEGIVKPKLTKKQVAALPPATGVWQAGRAIRELEAIAENDTERTKAFDMVKGWIAEHEAKA